MPDNFRHPESKSGNADRNMKIRRAEASDCETMAEIHRSSWLAAYSGLLPSEFLRRLLKRFPEATAIACDGDNVAFEFYWSLKDMGIRVPEDLSLTGFSGFPEVQRLIKLTTVDEHPHRIGFYAAELLVAILEKRVQEPVHELFEVEFINGATTAPPRTAGLPFVPQG